MALSEERTGVGLETHLIHTAAGCLSYRTEPFTWPPELTCAPPTVSSPSSDWSSFLGLFLLIGSLQTRRGRWTDEWATCGPWVASWTPSHRGNNQVGSPFQPPPLWLVHNSDIINKMMWSFWLIFKKLRLKFSCLLYLCLNDKSTTERRLNLDI